MSRGKRLVDIIGAGFGLVATAPLLLIIALAIRVSDGSPVLFRQVRVGRGGQTFLLYKFRTMRHAAGAQLITVAGDPRVTRPGRVLRQTKLDELPQLWNVLRGEMSLVGPRPEVCRYVERYTCDQRRVLDLTPGITDLASLTYFEEESVLAEFGDPETAYVERIMPDKIRLNLDYAAHATIYSDVVLVARTVGFVLRRISSCVRRTEEEKTCAGKA